MSRAGELSSLFRVYTGTEVSGTLSSKTTSWAQRGEVWGGFIPEFMTLRSYGGGEIPSGMREVEIHPGSDVRTRNGVEVLAGPESGTRWRVIHVDEADTDRWKMRIEPFTGAFS